MLRRKIIVLLGAPSIALVGAVMLWALWKALVDSEIVSPASLRYYVPITAIWFGLCFAGAFLLTKGTRQSGGDNS
jgi:hypothetical protein